MTTSYAHDAPAGRVAIVTGAASGIGRAAAVAITAAGAKVVADLDEAGGQETVEVANDRRARRAGYLGAFASDAACERVFGGPVWPIAGSQIAPAGGTFEPVSGGYV